MALGASRRAIARQLLCETAILVAVASFLALAIARIGVPVIVAWAPQDIPRLDEVAVSLRAAAFTALAGAALALLCWVVPALSLDSRALDAELRTSGRGFSSGGFSRPARRLLVVGEIAVAVVVLVFTGLLYRSVSRLGQIDLGFPPSTCWPSISTFHASSRVRPTSPSIASTTMRYRQSPARPELSRQGRRTAGR